MRTGKAKLYARNLFRLSQRCLFFTSLTHAAPFLSFQPSYPDSVVDFFRFSFLIGPAHSAKRERFVIGTNNLTGFSLPTIPNARGLFYDSSYPDSVGLSFHFSQNPRISAKRVRS